MILVVFMELSGKLDVDVRIVRSEAKRRFLIFLRKQQFHEYFIDHGVWDRSGYPGFLSRLPDFSNGVVRVALFSFHGVEMSRNVQSGNTQNLKS